jgi:hypothetical protein
MPWGIVAGGWVIVVVAAALWWLWWRLPKWQVNRLRLQIRDPKARADVEDNFRKTIGQLLGGVAVLVGAGIAYYQTQLTSQASRDQVISQQVSKGFEQLGSDKVVVRLGGIYALEGVMNTSEQYHQPVLEALCAFVRDGTKADTDQPPATDIQAAITVIGRRAAGTGVVDLTGPHIFGRHAAGTGVVDFTNSHISKADLGGADLSFAALTKADLTKALLSFTKLIRADLRDANLSGANLIGADLSFADLLNANLSGAALVNADLSPASGAGGANILTRLSEANLSGANLVGANLMNANLTKAELRGANLSGTNVSQSQLDAACGDKETRLPSGLTLKTCPF